MRFIITYHKTRNKKKCNEPPTGSRKRQGNEGVVNHNRRAAACAQLTQGLSTTVGVLLRVHPW